ncbi:MAG: hypothetical protein OXQ29_16605 [Rhodospirillaceae bacterium]|nr:hypothetical protein [Rhodospirillaceae bacterium]
MLSFVEHESQSVARPNLAVVDLAAVANSDDSAGCESLLACFGAHHEKPGHRDCGAHDQMAGSGELQRYTAVQCIGLRVEAADRDDPTSCTPFPPPGEQQLHCGYRSGDLQ